MDKVSQILILNCNLSTSNFGSEYLIPKIKDLFSSRAISVEVISQELDLPLFRQDGKEKLMERPEIYNLLERINRANSFIIISPEYHGFCTAVLKNLFEYLPVEKENRKVAMGIITANGEFGGSTSMQQLSFLVQKLKWIFFPDNLLVNNLKTEYNLNGILEKRLERVLNNFLSFILSYKNNNLL